MERRIDWVFRARNQHRIYPGKMVSISYRLHHRPISRVHVRYPGAMQVVLDVQEEAEEAKSRVSAIET